MGRITQPGRGGTPRAARRYCTQLRQDGLLINHRTGPERCPGSLLAPAELPAVANWLPLLPELTEHGQRHAHQVLMDDLNVRYVLQAASADTSPVQTETPERSTSLQDPAATSRPAGSPDPSALREDPPDPPAT